MASPVRAEALAATEAPSLAAAPGAPADPLTVELLTMGPGEHPFFKFGHNAIRIRDGKSGTDQVYNFGTFAFDSPTLIRDFFKGRQLYWLSRSSMAYTVEDYAADHRSLIAQQLELTPAQKRELRRALEVNARPKNRNYRYDYFFDNCSTRVRDAIDSVTHGQLRQAMRANAQQTLRDHALRSTADYFPEYLVLSIGLGPLVDRPVDSWAEAFLPEMLTRAVRTATVTNSEGEALPLVRVEVPILSERDTRAATPPRWLLRFLAAGLLSGLVPLALAYFARKHRAFAIALGVSVALVSLIAGLLGTALVALWLFTDHAVAYRNQNTLLLSPLALVLVWQGVRVAIRGVPALTGLKWPSLVLVVSASAALAFKVLPLEWQDNANLIAFCLPCWVGIWAASSGYFQR